MDVVMVRACLRDGAGGSPTAVVLDTDGLTGDDLVRVPARTGASHVAAVGGALTPEPVVRFFTRTGELPGCGHGTVAAIAALALAAPRDRPPDRLRIAGRRVAVSASVTPGTAGAGVTAWFDQGVVTRRAPVDGEVDAFLDALRADRSLLHPRHAPAVASPGQERLLLPVTDAGALTRLRPDLHRLAATSHRLGQLGCLVYVPPSAGGRAAARMFAPAVGVPEDVANANSTGCLAAVLLADGHLPDGAHLPDGGRAAALAVDQGDALGSPSTVLATARRTAAGIAVHVGGAARLAGVPGRAGFPASRARRPGRR